MEEYQYLYKIELYWLFIDYLYKKWIILFIKII